MKGTWSSSIPSLVHIHASAEVAATFLLFLGFWYAPGPWALLVHCDKALENYLMAIIQFAPQQGSLQSPITFANSLRRKAAWSAGRASSLKKKLAFGSCWRSRRRAKKTAAGRHSEPFVFVLSIRMVMRLRGRGQANGYLRNIKHRHFLDAPFASLTPAICEHVDTGVSSRTRSR